MRDNRHPDSRLLPAAIDAPNGMGDRAVASAESKTIALGGVRPRRRKSPEELAAAQRRSELKVLGEVRQGIGEMQWLWGPHVRRVPHPREQAQARRLLPYRLAIPAVAALVFVFGGAYFEWTLGSSFLAFGNAALRSATPWMVGILTPVFVLLFCRLEGAVPQLVEQIPGTFLRVAIAYPLLALSCAAAVAAAPWGWAAYLGWVAGTPSRVEVRLLSLEVLRDHVPCGQHARLEFRGAAARICVEDRLQTTVSHAGETVAVYGRLSRLGLYVREIYAK